MNKKGFSLIELLVVIAIIGVLLLISFPLINHLVEKNNEQKYNAYRGVIREAAKVYIDELGFLMSGCYEIKDGDKTGFEVLEEAGLLTNIEDDCTGTRVYILMNSEGKPTDYKVNLICNGKAIGKQEYIEKKCEYEVVQYKDAFNSNVDPNVNSPELNAKMIPIKYYRKDNTAQWIVADENNLKTSSVFEEDYAWYLYNQDYLANAVYVNEDAYSKYVQDGKFQVGTKLDEEDVTSWWVWIPRFEYNNTDIHYLINTRKAMKEGYKVHPAFTTTQQTGKKELTGFWINKNINLKSAVDENGSIVGDDMHSIQEYLDYGIDFSKENQSHVTRDLEFNAAYLINSDNETKINDMDQVQFTGGNYGGGSAYRFNNAIANIYYIGSSGSKGEIITECKWDHYDGLRLTTYYDCSNNWKICALKTNEDYMEGNISKCVEGRCTKVLKMRLKASPNGVVSFTNDEKSSLWYKYIDIYDDYVKNQMYIDDLCSKTDFNASSSASFQSPWTFRKSDYNEVVHSASYSVTYNFSSLYSQLNKEFLASNNIGHTTNMTGKTVKISATLGTNPLDRVFSYGTRLSMYY